MSKCFALLKAIDAYLVKVDDNLTDALEAAGFVDTGDLVADINDIESAIARASKRETRFIKRRLRAAPDLAAFAEDWGAIKDLDTIDEALSAIFRNKFNAIMTKTATSYLTSIDSELMVSSLSQRTVDWVQDWSVNLGRLMKLSTHNAIDTLLVDNLRDGNSVAEFTRALQNSGIRDEYSRARAVALTELLRAHSVAQQEAIIQNPAVDNKRWVHTGTYRNVPRANHVDIDGQIVRKDQPFALFGEDGNMYYPMYPRCTSLPVGETVNCHCIHQAIVNESVLGLSLEERQELQARAIEADNGLWERELSARNRALAGIL